MRLAWVAGLILLATGCVSPVPEVWPPPAGSPAHDIVVSVDTWHAVIAIPQNSSPQPSRSSPLAPSPAPRALLYEEWSYAEHAWYLEGRQGFTGVLRALFWPTAGVVEVGTHARPWSERTPDPPAEEFRFTVSEEGYAGLRRFLEGSREAEMPLRVVGGRAFYPARRAYSFLHQCHQYAARALRAAGLPVSSRWAMTRSLFVAQLRRAERLATQAVPQDTPQPAGE